MRDPHPEIPGELPEGVSEEGLNERLSVGHKVNTARVVTALKIGFTAGRWVASAAEKSAEVRRAVT